MNKPMTPSTQSLTTDGQIDKATDIFRAGLRKHRDEFSQEAIQQVLGVKDLSQDLLAVVRKHVERFSNMIVRVVETVQDRTPEQALTATGRNQYTDKKVVAAMPRGIGKGPKKVTFFKVGRRVTDEELEAEYASRNLKPTDSFTLAAANEADPVFADEHPNGTHWKDANGNWCYAAFHRWHDERCVSTATAAAGMTTGGLPASKLNLRTRTLCTFCAVSFVLAPRFRKKVRGISFVLRLLW